MKNYHVWLLETSYHTLFQVSLPEAGVMCSSLHKYTTWCGPELKLYYVPALALPFCRCRGLSSSPGPHGNVGSGKCCSAASALHQADHDAQDPDTRAVSKTNCWHHSFTCSGQSLSTSQAAPEITGPLTLHSPAQVLAWEWLEACSVTCASRAGLLGLYRRPWRPTWLASLKTPTAVQFMLRGSPSFPDP